MDSLHQLCDLFELELKEGRSPEIEHFLRVSPKESASGMLRELLRRELAFLDSANSEWSAETYLDRFSTYGEVVRDVLENRSSWNDETESPQSNQISEPAIVDVDASLATENWTLDQADVLPGLHLENYLVKEQIGKGGMGVVYLARQLKLDRDVALKVLNIPGIALAENQDRLERFRQEPVAAGRLEHDNIIKVYDVGESNGIPYFTMQYVEGQSLREAIKESVLSPKQAATVLHEVADAIDYAHNHDVLHRDLKPENILLDSNERPLVTDFGVARLLEDDSQRTRTGTLMGTFAYMPPEQAKDSSRADERSDVYSLGATLYCCLTGRPPFVAANHAEILQQLENDEPVAPSRLNPAVPKDLETICQKCLEKDPNKRYQTADELSTDLKRYLDGRPIVARPIGPIGKIQRWCSRHRAVAGLGGTCDNAIAWSCDYRSDVSDPRPAVGERTRPEFAKEPTQWCSFGRPTRSMDGNHRPDCKSVRVGSKGRSRAKNPQIEANHALNRPEEARRGLAELRSLGAEKLGPHAATVQLMVVTDLATYQKDDRAGLLQALKKAKSLGLSDAQHEYVTGMEQRNSAVALEHFRRGLQTRSLQFGVQSGASHVRDSVGARR